MNNYLAISLISLILTILEMILNYFDIEREISRDESMQKLKELIVIFNKETQNKIMNIMYFGINNPIKDKLILLALCFVPLIHLILLFSAVTGLSEKLSKKLGEK